jgi:hypothetical protein
MRSPVGGFSAFGIGRLHVRRRMIRYAAANSFAAASLMRHFLPLPGAPALLTGRMQMCAAAASLVARPRPAQRLAPANARTLPATVNVAVIAALADAHLHAATSAVVEPIGRLLQRLQTPPPAALDSTRQGRHKGPAQLPPRRCASGIRGLSTPIKNPGSSFSLLARAA